MKDIRSLTQFLFFFLLRKKICFSSIAPPATFSLQSLALRKKLKIFTGEDQRPLSVKRVSSNLGTKLSHSRSFFSKKLKNHQQKQWLKGLILVFFAFFCVGTFYYTLSHFEQKKTAKAPVKVIVQTGPIKEGLKTDYFAEILGLSIDAPKCLDIEDVKQILKESPLIKNASASYLNPETLYIDYTLRKPAFALIDLQNTALDLEGHLFPLSPFFTPKKLPELCLGLKTAIPFQKPLQGKEVGVAIEIYHLLKEEVKRIDLSQMTQSSLGKREIVVILELGSGVEHILRLSTKRYKKELSNYHILKDAIQDKDLIIDLRVPKLAYITGISRKVLVE